LVTTVTSLERSQNECQINNFYILAILKICWRSVRYILLSRWRNKRR